MPKGVDMKVWLAYLAFCGLEYKRTEASHDIYDMPDNSLLRPITVRPSKDMEVPMLHMHTTLKTLGKQMKDFTAWQNEAMGKGGKVKKFKPAVETPEATSPPITKTKSKPKRARN